MTQEAPLPPWRRAPQLPVPGPQGHLTRPAPLCEGIAKPSAASAEGALLAVPTAARGGHPEHRTAGSCTVGEHAEAILDRSAPWISAKPPSPGTGPEPRYLEMVNANPRDDRLEFDAASHTYFLEGRALSGSVTFVASSMSEDFDGRAVVQAMRNGRSQAWPRLRYTLGAQPADLGALAPAPSLYGLLLEERPSQRTRAAMSPDEVVALFTHCSGDVARWRLALQEELLNRACMTFGPGPSMSIGPQWQLWSYEREMTEEEILEQWQQCGQDAAERGTEAHYQIELWLNRDGCRSEEMEV
ncbi:unnamed protein product, partial [Symbiodinium natans]